MSSLTPDAPSVNVYVPLDSRTILEYAKQVCEELAQSHDPQFAAVDVAYGLAAFLDVVSRIGANSLNQQQSSANPLT